MLANWSADQIMDWVSKYKDTISFKLAAFVLHANRYNGAQLSADESYKQYTPGLFHTGKA